MGACPDMLLHTDTHTPHQVPQTLKPALSLATALQDRVHLTLASVTLAIYWAAVVTEETWVQLPAQPYGVILAQSLLLIMNVVTTLADPCS